MEMYLIALQEATPQSAVLVQQLKASLLACMSNIFYHVRKQCSKCLRVQ